MDLLKATIEKRSEKEYAVLLGAHEIGISKNDTDARFHMYAINDAIRKAYHAGLEDGQP